MKSRLIDNLFFYAICTAHIYKELEEGKKHKASEEEGLAFIDKIYSNEELDNWVPDKILVSSDQFVGDRSLDFYKGLASGYCSTWSRIRKADIELGREIDIISMFVAYKTLEKQDLAPESELLDIKEWSVEHVGDRSYSFVNKPKDIVVVTEEDLKDFLEENRTVH